MYLLLNCTKIGYFRQADGVLVMFDITDKSSFFSKISDKNHDDNFMNYNIEIEEFWMKQIDENCKPETERVLVGNKVDLTEVITTKYF